MTETFDHILVPYNGCAGSQKAFKKAVMLSKVIQSKITVLTCIEERSTFGLFKTKTDKQELEKEQKAVMNDHLTLDKYAKKHAVSPMFKIIKNDMAAHAILEYAEKHGVDLIIMGMRNKTKYEKMHYPSTIEDVSKNFRGAVLILN